MDTLFILAGVLGVGDILLARVWLRERRLRRKAETHANDAIREKYKLLDVIERKAASHTGRPVVVRMPVRAQVIQSTIDRPQTRQTAPSGSAV